MTKSCRLESCRLFIFVQWLAPDSKSLTPKRPRFLRGPVVWNEEWAATNLSVATNPVCREDMDRYKRLSGWCNGIILVDACRIYKNVFMPLLTIIAACMGKKLAEIKYDNSEITLPSRFAIHNWTFSLYFLSPQKLCWSVPFHSPHASPLWQLCLFLLTSVQSRSMDVVLCQDIEHLTTGRQQDSGQGTRNRGVVPERVFTMLDRMRSSASM